MIISACPFNQTTTTLESPACSTTSVRFGLLTVIAGSLRYLKTKKRGIAAL